MKLSKDEHVEIRQVLHLGRNRLLQQYRVGTDGLWSSFAGKDVGSRWTAHWP